jgi:retron-type reverse transcriptase
MKRIGTLWGGLISFANLLRAARQAARGKRYRPAVLRFNDRLEDQLWRLHDELHQHCYQPGAYRQFYIHDPKKRLISAAPYRDRVVHHALVNVLEPIWERSFIADSFASRKGKGTHAAMSRCQEFARRDRWVWKADVQQFFPSIDHALLKGLLARKVKDPDVLWLAGVIIDHSPPPDEQAERVRGLPVGNQTSQFLGNVYLDPLDHFVKDVLGVPGYARYVDDFVLFAPDKAALHAARRAVADVLAGLRLRLHPTKDAIFPVRQGIRFVGYRIWPTHVKLPARNVYRFRRRLRRLQVRYARHEIDSLAVASRINSWLGHAGQADTWRLRQRLLAEHPFRRAPAG